MAKDPNPPVSVRLPPDLASDLAAIMAENGDRKLGTAMLRLLRLGIQTHRDVVKYVVKEGPTQTSEKAGQLKRAKTPSAFIPAADVGKVLVAELRRSVAAVEAEPITPHEGEDGVYVGRKEEPPGSRLKGATKGRGKWK